MRHARSVFLMLVSICSAANLAQAANSVTIESKTVMVGAKNVRIGVFLENEDPIFALSLPFEFRELAVGSYMTTRFSRGITPGQRIALSPYTCRVEVSGGCPGVDFYTRRLYSAPSGSPCSGPTANTYQVPSPSVNFVSPDAHYWEFLMGFDPAPGSGLPSGYLVPGTDGSETPNASLFFDFDVSLIPGQFIIDTCCVYPSRHLRFYDTLSQVIIPTFTPGIITIACECPCLNDPYCDGEGPDVLDIVTAIDAAFNGVGEPRDEFCPEIRTDFDCNNYTNVVDVVRLIDVAFREADPAAMLTCVPCPSP